MSTTEGRRERMQRLLKCLGQNPQGLQAHEIAQKTDLLTEITMDRLHKYLAELEWAGSLEQVDLHWRILYKRDRETEREREKDRKGKRDKENGSVRLK